MKKLLAIIFTVAISAASYAGCGLKVAVEGKLTAFDAEKKTLTIDKQTVTLAASATITDADGKAAKIESLIGKNVNVSTDKHTKKAESVKGAKS